MGVSINIESNRPTIVNRYLNDTIQQMRKNRHFLISSWKVEQKVESDADTNLITVRDIRIAEAVKLFKNIHKDVNIALANELALFCEKTGLDFIEVLEVANTHPECHMHFPGLVSGHISNDPYLIVDEAENVNLKLRMVPLARKINDGMLKHTLRLTINALRQCKKTLRRAKITIFGISSIPDVKDAQGSSVNELINMLRKRNVNVTVYDPLFSPKELRELGFTTKRTLTKTVEDIDCLIITVGHNKFKSLNLRKIKSMANNPAAIIDMGRIIDPAKAEREGFVYQGVGRGI